MIRWQVLWQPAAERQLAEIYNHSDQKQLVTDAANRLDRALKADPFGIGESRDENTRVAFEYPLRINYDVMEEDCRVWCWPSVACGRRTSDHNTGSLIC
jgi:hypothetical protein